jgi:hypothetical protein
MFRAISVFAIAALSTQANAGSYITNLPLTLDEPLRCFEVATSQEAYATMYRQAVDALEKGKGAVPSNASPQYETTIAAAKEARDAVDQLLVEITKLCQSAGNNG